MIRSFVDAETQAVFLTGTSQEFAEASRIAARKLQAVDFAAALEDLQEPPGNRLRQLEGGSEVRWSIRVNERRRVCFRWDGEDAWDVELAGDR